MASIKPSPDKKPKNQTYALIAIAVLGIFLYAVGARSLGGAICGTLFWSIILWGIWRAFKNTGMSSGQAAASTVGLMAILAAIVAVFAAVAGASNPKPKGTRTTAQNPIPKPKVPTTKPQGSPISPLNTSFDPTREDQKQAERNERIRVEEWQRQEAMRQQEESRRQTQAEAMRQREEARRDAELQRRQDQDRHRW